MECKNCKKTFCWVCLSVKDNNNKWSCGGAFNYCGRTDPVQILKRKWWNSLIVFLIGKKAKIIYLKIILLLFNTVSKRTFPAISIKIIYHIEKSIIIQTFLIRGGSPIKFRQIVNIIYAATIWKFSAISLITSVD